MVSVFHRIIWRRWQRSTFATIGIVLEENTLWTLALSTRSLHLYGKHERQAAMTPFSRKSALSVPGQRSLQGKPPGLTGSDSNMPPPAKGRDVANSHREPPTTIEILHLLRHMTEQARNMASEALLIGAWVGFRGPGPRVTGYLPFLTRRACHLVRHLPFRAGWKLCREEVQGLPISKQMSHSTRHLRRRFHPRPDKGRASNKLMLPHRRLHLSFLNSRRGHLDLPCVGAPVSKHQAVVQLQHRQKDLDAWPLLKRGNRICLEAQMIPVA